MRKLFSTTLVGAGLLALAGTAAATPHAFSLGVFFGAPAHAARPVAPVHAAPLVQHAQPAYVERRAVHAPPPAHGAYRAPRGHQFYEERATRRAH